MSKSEKPFEPENVECEICLKEIPLSEAKNAEAVDYVHHFCGLECYAKWKKKNGMLEPDIAHFSEFSKIFSNFWITKRKNANAA